MTVIESQAVRRKAFWDLNKVVAAAVVFLGEWWSAGSWFLLLKKVGSIPFSGESGGNIWEGKYIVEVLMDFLKAAYIGLTLPL